MKKVAATVGLFVVVAALLIPVRLRDALSWPVLVGIGGAVAGVVMLFTALSLRSEREGSTAGRFRSLRSWLDKDWFG